MTSRIYLDNAATSWPKSAAAVQAAFDFVNHCGATAGRGTYASSRIADRWILDARRHLAKLIGAADPRTIAFCSSGTHALNTALLGLLVPGDHVVTTQIEHNSVLRPLHHLQLEKQIAVDIAQCDDRGMSDSSNAEALIRDNTKLLVVGHVSNVTGIVQDLSAWSRLAKQCGAKLVVDASQSLGYLPIDVDRQCIDILAAAGHKGLRALPGTGLLYVRSELAEQLRPSMRGGTGVQSESMDASADWPQSVEVGNLNLSGIVSMAVAAQELNLASENSPVLWQTQWREPLMRLVAGLRSISGVRVLGYDLQLACPGSELSQVDHVPLVSITVDGWSVHDLASILDSSFGIEVRAGYHCAALIHRSLGTASGGGTLRISPGHSTTTAEIDQLLLALQQIIH